MDSTKAHIARVQELCTAASEEITARGRVHDASKLLPPEVELFDECTPLLAGTEFLSAEYLTIQEKLRPAIEHHYAHNSHHPEHYPDGIEGMDLFDLLEMFLDWKAATERHPDGDLAKSITLNAKRFSMAPQLVRIFENTLPWVSTK